MEIYIKSLKVLEHVYILTATLPKSESFNMISQINRSALSISSNIAEGSGRGSDKDFARFLSMAKGSLYETFSVASAINIVYPIYAPEIHNLQSMLDELEKEITLFHKYLNRVPSTPRRGVVRAKLDVVTERNPS